MLLPCLIVFSDPMVPLSIVSSCLFVPMDRPRYTCSEDFPLWDAPGSIGLASEAAAYNQIAFFPGS